MQNPAFVQDAFAKISERYVVTNHVLSLGIDILWRKKAARIVRDWQPRRVLDLATGSGDLAMEISRKSPQAEIIGADFCPEMLETARKRQLPRIEWMVADAMNLPFSVGEFDVVTVAFGLRNMASWPDALREMARVLRPGGHLLVLDFSLPRLPGVRGAYRFYLHKVMPRVAGWITRQRQAYDYLSQSIEKFPSGADMTALMQQSGFASARATPLSLGVASIYLAQKAP
jgi:demethylmenaquinone methyltransferase/2-methoxy-6-polyprenyl-1,4-benzoquinol methylase